MGRRLHDDFSVARRVFGEATAILGRDVAGLCFDGPAEALRRTANTQVAVFVVDVAALRVLIDHGIDPAAVAGHSVGEFAALHAAGAVEFAECVRLVAARGELMGSVSRPGAMAAVFGLDDDVVESVCAAARTEGPIVVALHNAPGLPVVSGSVTAVARFTELARESGAKRVAPLDVGSAFHSPLMEEVGGRWAALVDALALDVPRCPIALNATGAMSVDPDEIRRAVKEQLTSPVRWVDCITALADLGVTDVVEAGDSKTLAGLARRTDSRFSTHSMADANALDHLVEDRLTV